MTPAKVLEVIAIYRKKLEDLQIPKEEFPHTVFARVGSTDECRIPTLAHCHKMLDQMEVFVREGRMEKVFRWIGFIQGVLWRCGLYTIEEMKEHNRP